MNLSTIRYKWNINEKLTEEELEFVFHKLDEVEVLENKVDELEFTIELLAEL